MIQTFKLKKGEISFDRDKIIIFDNARKQKRKTLLTSTSWTFFGIMSVLRYMQTGDHFLLWTGLIIGIGHFLKIIFTLLRTVQNEISLKEVKSIKVKQRLGNKFLDINLKTNRPRRVFHVENSDLLNYVETNFKTP